MPVDAPPLTRATLESSLKGALRHTRRLFAFYGTGEPAELTVGERTVQIVPVASEIDLRRKMPALDDEVPRAFLVPWRGEVPLDLAGRFAENGRVRLVDKGEQIASLCGAATASEDVRGMALATYLLRKDNPRERYPVPVGNVTAGELLGVWLDKDWGVPMGSALGRDALLGWAALDGRGPEFCAAMEHPAATGVREELLKHLESLFGALGPLCWLAWERGTGRRVLQMAVLCEVLVPTLASTPQAGLLRYWLREQLQLSKDASELPLAQNLAQTAGPALSWVRNRDSSFDDASLLKEAEALVPDDLRSGLGGSTRLPSGWQQRLERLGALLVRAAGSPQLELAVQVDRARRELESHEFFQRKDSMALAYRAEMATRLVYFLCQRTDQRRQAGLAAHAEVEVLAAWYAEEGGFVDWARHLARGSDVGALGRGVQAVVAAVDEIRDELDRRFAGALAAWVDAGRPSQNVLPIDQALKRIAVRFLEQDDERRLLVLLMDGMAWAQAVEILESLADPRNRWAPLAWHRLRGNGVGEDTAYPPMLAALPTITEVSRSAFFAGRPMKPGESLDAGRDPEQFAANKALYPFCAPTVKPRLLLRGESHTSDGSASREALTLIAATEESRVVGIVVNAIDASLKGDVQQQSSWTVDSIRSLRDLLNAAREAGRHVLVVADHGHVPADRLRCHSSPAQAGARWRASKESENALQPGERLFRGNGVYTPRGAEGVILLEGDDKRYGGAAHAGEHGGAALAEVVAPCVLIGWEDPIAAERDPALKLVAQHVPEWWSRSLPLDVARGSEAPASVRPKPGRKRREPSEDQLGLPGLAPPVSEAKGAAALPQDQPGGQVPLLPALESCAMLRVRAPLKGPRAAVVRAVAFLLERSCVAPASAFGAHIGEPAFRVPGAVSKLQEVLNVDGYEVLRYDRENQQIFLDREKLEQQFEVKL